MRGRLEGNATSRFKCVVVAGKKRFKILSAATNVQRKIAPNFSAASN